jgi:NAD(P)-dependent dehydrogenase (short-subunit alcohol dehydrogenase family)
VPRAAAPAGGIVHRLDAWVTADVTRLQGKKAIVTGGGTGIGRAIALALGRAGAKVAVLGRRRDVLREVAEQIKQAGGEAVAVTCDVSSDKAVRAAIGTADEVFEGLNVLVNNAGALSVSTVESIAEDDWDRVIDTNLKGPFLMSRAVLPAFHKARGGSIINVSSVLGLVGMKDRAAYCASKGGLVLLTKAMALDHAHQNVRVNCICPAIIETELVKGLFEDSEQGRQAKRARVATLPLGRFGRPEDIGDLAVFLASEESSWMTGTAIPVDGGLTAY